MPSQPGLSEAAKIADISILREFQCLRRSGDTPCPFARLCIGAGEGESNAPVFRIKLAMPGEAGHPVASLGQFARGFGPAPAGGKRESARERLAWIPLHNA